MPKQGQQKGTPARRAEFIEHLRTLGPGHFCVNWPWSEARGRYVSVHIDGKKVLAHRWVYEQVTGNALEHMDRPGATGDVGHAHLRQPFLRATVAPEARNAA